MTPKQAWLGIAGFCLSLGNALVALPKGDQFVMADFVAIPLVCLLIALGNGIMAGMGQGKRKEGGV